jgi:(2Fe-2S) ferredoxin/SAM-dependent methyltransferase
MVDLLERESMQPFRYHVIVCTQQKSDDVPCCAAAGGVAVVDALREQLRRKELADHVIVSTTGCLGTCDRGPVMVVYPDAAWYAGVTPADVAEIVSSHLKEGRAVARLMITDKAALRAEILDHRQKHFAALAARDKAGILPENISLHGDFFRSFMASRAWLTALELDVFTAVGSGASAQWLAARLRTDARATEMLLNALVALNLLTKSGDLFANTPMTARFLSADSPDDGRPGLMHNVELWNAWSTLTECVRRGGSVYRRPSGDLDEESARTFMAAVDRTARDSAAQVVRAVGNGFQRMLDLGGGSATYSIAFAQANPQVCIDVLDLPTVVPVTQEYIRRAGLEARVHTRAGDMRTEPFGQGYDLVLLFAITHSFSSEENRDLLGRIYQALAPGGRLALRDYILDSGKTSPAIAALFSLNMLVNTEGGACYSEAEYNGWLRATGFREIRRVRMPGAVNLIIASK